MLNSSDFNPVSLSDRELFKRQYERFPQVHSDNTFTNMVCWNHYADYRYAFLRECIVISNTIYGKTRYRPPIGPQDPDLLAEVMSLAARSEDERPLTILDPGSKNWISSLYPDLTLNPERNYFDYVYLTSDLADLPGKGYQTIRKQLNQFQRDCSPIVEPITDSIMPEVKEFLLQWCDWKNCSEDPLLASEEEAVMFALSHYSDLDLSGLIIRADGKVGAMAVFEGMNEDTALVHFEKGLPDCKAIYRAINAETARLLASDYAFINRESDMGVEGMREAKTRYHPHHMVEVYSVSRADIEKVV